MGVEDCEYNNKKMGQSGDPGFLYALLFRSNSSKRHNGSLERNGDFGTKLKIRLLHT